MNQVVPIEHDSKAWHDTRARHVGGSEIAALFDLSADQIPAYTPRRFALWHIKAGNAPPIHVDNPRVKWGLKLERVVAEAAAEQEGWIFHQGGYASDATTPGLGCTLDFVIESDPKEDGPGALECKNVDWLVHKRSWQDEPPTHILLQLQHQLAATGYSWGVVAGLIGGNEIKVYRYKARPLLIAEIRRRVREFWASIDAGKEPRIDGSDSASAVLASLYPEIVDDAVDMRQNNEWAEAAHGLWKRAEERKLAEAAYELAKNRVAKILDGHKRGWGNGWSVSAAITKENPGKAIAPEDVGKVVGKRKESRSYTAKEMTT